MAADVTAGSYFSSDVKDVDFFSSGCTLLDCALGGGWPEGRVTNVYGSRSAGKTGHAIEAVANYAIKYPDADIYYAETESAFDKGYACAMGLPLGRVSFAEDDDLGVSDCCHTVEGLFEYVERVLEIQTEAKRKAFIIVDSLDALSDRTELSGTIDQASYGANKAKRISQMFRRVISQTHKAGITMMFVSQVRDNIGGMGASQTVSGGKALAFYCSIIVQLAAIKTLKRTLLGVERPIGTVVRAKVKKNKVGLPFREAEYPLIFGYGFSDITASMEWLASIKADIPYDAIGCKATKIGVSNFCRKMRDVSKEEHDKVHAILTAAVKEKWNDIEVSFMPKRSKY